MSSFTDKLGRAWQLDITVAAMRRAKRQSIDLSMPVSQLQSYVMDDVFLTDALFAIIEPDAKAKGVTLEQFESGLDGKVIAVARESLWEALYEYFDVGKSEMLRAAVASVHKEMLNATSSITGSGSGSSKVNSEETSAPTD